MKPKTYKEDDEEEPDLIPMMGTMATVEDEEIDDVSLLGTGKKRRKKKKYVPTRAEIWHEADRLWMMAELLEREREREERRAQRLALTGSELEPVPPPGSPPAATDGDSPRFTATSRGKSRHARVLPGETGVFADWRAVPAVGHEDGAADPGWTRRARGHPAGHQPHDDVPRHEQGREPRRRSARPVTVARYVVDFGNVVKGAALSKRFTFRTSATAT